ncbi:hypothetical protein [Pseudonocardia sp. TRM90224]|uniref:hypothetical protein n=1 Tax=Pseudonocardia sp. TRM90224 TaxID=2812678 RepID=UPI001E388D81|nr:hypothetical protein [Pseudonocardia sp. TRM90224]
MMARHGRGFLRGFSGLLAGGLVLLALVLVATQFLAAGTDGPGTSMLVWHGVAAVVAVGAQVHADRTPGPRGTVAALVVVGIAAAVLAFLWLA